MLEACYAQKDPEQCVQAFAVRALAAAGGALGR